MSFGKASTICWAVHSAVGCSVTLKWTRPTIVGEHDQDEEDAQQRGGDREEIEGHQVPDVVGEEGPPGLGRRRVPHAWAGISGGAEPALSGRDGTRQGQRVRATIREGSQSREGNPCAGQKSHPLVPPQLPSASPPPDPVESRLRRYASCREPR